MNDLQIDYFMAVGTNLSFTKTSQELYVSQPAISKQIKLMEEELGVRLFYRNNKKTELTLWKLQGRVEKRKGKGCSTSGKRAENPENRFYGGMGSDADSA